MPFSWKNIDGFFSYQDFYDAIVKWLRPGESFVEVGSLMGKSIAYAATRKKQLKKPLKLFAIDHGILDVHLKKLTKYKKHHVTTGFLVNNLRRLHLLRHVTHVVGDSARSASLFPDNSLAFVYIDACHLYDAVTADVRAWLPKIQPGGIIAGHDYTNKRFPGVKEAVDEIFGFECHLPQFGGGVWAVVKDTKDGQPLYAPLRERIDHLTPN
jgi:hypothetical protein